MSAEDESPGRSLAGVLRRAQRTYSGVLRQALARQGHDDIPPNGLFIIGFLATRGAAPIHRLVAALGITKQGAGQLVDGLVTRGYLARRPDDQDRRRILVTLTSRGHEAAAVQARARERLEAALARRVGAQAIDQTLTTLTALIDLGAAPSEETGP